MKVHELITALEKQKAGTTVRIYDKSTEAGGDITDCYADSICEENDQFTLMVKMEG